MMDGFSLQVKNCSCQVSKRDMMAKKKVIFHTITSKFCIHSSTMQKNHTGQELRFIKHNLEKRNVNDFFMAVGIRLADLGKSESADFLGNILLTRENSQTVTVTHITALYNYCKQKRIREIIAS